MSTIGSTGILNVAVRTPLGHARSMLYKCCKCKKENIQPGEALLPGSGIPGSELLKLFQLVGEFPAGVTPFVDPMHPLKVGDMARLVRCGGCATHKDLRLLKVAEVMDKWVEQNIAFANEFGDIPILPPPEPETLVTVARAWPGLACSRCSKAVNSKFALVPPVDEMYAQVHPGLKAAPPLSVAQIAARVQCSRCSPHGWFPFLKTVALMERWTTMGWEWRERTESAIRPKRDVQTPYQLSAVESHTPKRKKERRRRHRGPKPIVTTEKPVGKNYGDNKEDTSNEGLGKKKDKKPQKSKRKGQ